MKSAILEPISVQNVQILLRQGAKRSLACIERNSLQLTAEFSRPYRKNNSLSGLSAASSFNAEPTYKEDMYAGDRHREDIVCLLDGRELDDPVTLQLESFAFQRAYGNDVRSTSYV